MAVVSIVFSPTGGTKKAVDMLSEAIPGEKIFIDLTDPDENYASASIGTDDISLIAMPVYGGRAPVLAMERFREIKGNGSRCLLLAVYGNRDFEDTLVEIQDAAEECGFRVTGAIAAVAEHSVVHQYAAGRPDNQDREELHRAAENWLTALESNQGTPEIPGNRPYTKPMSLSLVPKPAKGCIGCGKCRNSCPAGAIDENFIADKRKCVSCMRCVTLWPVGARKPGQLMVKLSAAVLKKDCSERKNIKVYF